MLNVFSGVFVLAMLKDWGFFVEIILHKKKWLINCSYNPNKNNIKNDLEIISKALDAFSTKYENIILLRDLNVCVDDETMRNFCNSYNLKSLIKQPACIKNPENLSCIYLILTNKSRSFQSTCVIETGLSDFHRMTVSVLKTHFRKLPPKVVTYRDFYKFENEKFMDSLKLTINSQDVDYTKNPQLFFELCRNELEHHDPRKKKYLRGNNKPFMTKALSKTIMERTRLRNTFLKNPIVANKLAYTKQRNVCVSLLKKVKSKYFANLNEKDLTNSRKFWQSVKPFLSEKNRSREKITLVKNEEIISDDVEGANTLNNYFSNVVKNLKIPKKFVADSLPQNLSRHPTLNAILKYKNRPSMRVIKRFSQRFSSFYLSHVDKNTVLKEIKKLNLNKEVQYSDIPVKILKENADFFADYIYHQFNEAVDSSKFADFFKSADILAAFKQGSRNKKEKYRPISILPLISKIFEKIICRQLSNHFGNILSKFQCGFRTGYSPQHCLLLMIDKWEKAVDNHKVFGAVLTGLSKAFDCICHDLLIAKLNAYGLSLPALKLITDYL